MIILIGFPKSGNKSFQKLFELLGYNSIHHITPSGQHICNIIKKNKENNMPLLRGLQEYQCITQLDGCVSKNICYWPQISDYKQLYYENRDSIFILNKHNPTNLLNSFKNWNNLLDRFYKYNPEIIDDKTDEGFIRFVENYYNDVIKFFNSEKESKFIVFDIENDNIEKLKIYIDIKNIKTFPKENVSNIVNKKPITKNKWIVLLTTAVSSSSNKITDTEYRKNLYSEQILKWLNKTNFMIVVVESSGYNYPNINNERLYKVSFKITEKFSSSSQYEANSILYALNEISNCDFYKNCTHILKVTGRYFLDNIENHLNSKPQNKDLYLQKHRNDKIKWQNSEYYGIRKQLFPVFLENVKTIGLMEKELWKFSINKTGCHIGYFENNIRRGGDKLLIKNL